METNANEPAVAAGAPKGRRSRLAIILAVAGLLLLGMPLLAVWRLARPVPFEGPHSGRVLDATTGLPVVGAAIEAKWTCYDDPWPLSHRARYLASMETTDASGGFALRRAAGRRGLMGTEFVLTVRAEGYIDAVFIRDPTGIPLPPQTVAWPFVDTVALRAMPATLTVKLKPALPVLDAAAGSVDPLIRDTAVEHIEKLSRSASAPLRQAAGEALGRIGSKQIK